MGQAHGRYSHGRYSKVLPVRILARYRQASKDADLTALRSEIALLDARVGDLLTRIDTGESGAPLVSGVQDYDAWAAIQELIEQRRKLVDTERKRLITLQQTITAERATLMLGVVVDIIAKHIKDRAVLSQIAVELQRLGSAEDPAYGVLDEGSPRDAEPVPKNP
jgi:hypothetical protein